MLRLKEGDAVRIIDREPTHADLRNGLYYNHYRNLAGTVFKLYGTGDLQQAAVDIALETLPEDVAKRHMEVTDQMRANLTGDARRTSGPGGDNEFRLRYVILVSVADLARRPSTASRHAGNGHKA